MSSSRGSSQLRNQTRVSSIVGRFFTIRATREDCQVINGLNEHRYLLQHALWTILQTSYNSETYKLICPKGNQPRIFGGRTAAEAEAPVLWPLDVKNWFIRKDPDTGKDWRQEKGMTEDKIVGWHHWLNGHEFEQALGNGEGQGSLACCSPWGLKELDMTEQLNNNDNRLRRKFRTKAKSSFFWLTDV